MSSISNFEFTSNSYSKSSSTNPIATVNTCFGHFSSTTGLDIDASVGLINLKNSSVGTYSVTYTIEDGENVDTTSKNITITA